MSCTGTFPSVQQNTTTGFGGAVKYPQVFKALHQTCMNSSALCAFVLASLAERSLLLLGRLYRHICIGMITPKCKAMQEEWLGDA